jgi:RHS repeat-associated protein
MDIRSLHKEGHFAGLEHDSGSNTDHAQFRQYSNAQGRWMGMDPYAGSYDFSNPQSLNRYSYAGQIAPSAALPFLAVPFWAVPFWAVPFWEAS